MVEPYAVFETFMSTNYPDYSWEPLSATTSDEYELTLFHLWKEGEMDDEKTPLLFQHGHYLSALNWLEYFTNYGGGEPAIFFDAIDEGHHVYLGNLRGTEWSTGHASLDYQIEADQQAYWDFSHGDYYKDVIANGQAIKENFTGTEKPVYVGYSQGTVQLLIGLTLVESEITDLYQRAVLLAPCTIFGTDADEDRSPETVGTIGTGRSRGIYSVPQTVPGVWADT